MKRRVIGLLMLVVVAGCSAELVRQPSATDSGSPAIDAPAIDAPAIDAPAVDVSITDVASIDIRDVAVDDGVDPPVDARPSDGPCPSSDETRCGGVCTRLLGDRDNCGACGVRCCTGGTCRNGQCSWSCAGPGLTVCGRPAEPGCDREAVCVNLNTDAANCGACGNACPAGRPCINGSCTGCGACTAGSTCCGGACVDVSTNADNCGACGIRCPAGRPCIAGRCGACSCPSGQVCCGDSCVALSIDPNNCGACRVRCAAGEVCAAGACRGSTFMALAPCIAATDYVAGATVRFGDALGSVYSPRCITVRVGDTVTWEGSLSGHPLSPSTRGSSLNPIPATSSGAMVGVPFRTRGFYPYYCTAHGSDSGSGMAGVVQVIE